MSTPYKHVLVPIDFSEPSRQALDEGIALALLFGAKLTLVHVYEVPYVYTGMALPPVDLLTPIQEAARRLLDESLALVRQRLPDADAALRCGSPWHEIVAVAKGVGADLIVIGTHGRSGLSHVLLGSVAEKVVRHAPVPVLTVRPRELAKSAGSVGCA